MAETKSHEGAVRLPQSGFDFYTCLKSKGTLAKFNSRSMKIKSFPPEVQQMINYCTPALEHGRPLNKVMIVLVGQTGSGKSSTVNYLFHDNICTVNSSSSETRKVTEYGKELCVTSESPPVIGILSFVDPPGALDVDHTKEPLNLATISKFRNEHLDLLPRKGLMGMSSKVREQVYPNLVLLNVKANDNRMDGPDSNLRKCLKALNKYGLLDKQHTNLMVVVTHAMNIPEKKYVEKKEETTRIIQDAILKVLRLRDVQVIFVENVPEDYYMPREEGCDFYQLPDGQLSHYNLIKAMEAHFDKDNDVLGKLLCGWYFGDDCPEKNNKANVLKDIAHTQLTEEEASKALQELLSMDMQFCVQEEITAPPFNFLILGRGYCPKSEVVTECTIYPETETTRIKLLGTLYNIPKCFEIVEVNEHDCYPLTFETEEMYGKDRMLSYGLDEDVKLVLRLDSTGRWLKGSVTTTDPVVSVVFEKRLLNAKLVNPGTQVKPQLTEAINRLPVKYNQNSAHIFSEFFSKWGSHFVSKVLIGGDIKVDCILNASEFSSEALSYTYKTVHEAFSYINSCTKGESDFKLVDCHKFSLGISGGDPPRVSTLDELTPVRYSDWVQSIKKNPEELQYSLKLTPYYILTTGLRGLSFAEATQQYLDGTIPDYLPIRKDIISSRLAYSAIPAEIQMARTPSQIRRDRKTQVQKDKDREDSYLAELPEEEASVAKLSAPLPTRKQVANEMVENAKVAAKREEKCFPAWAEVHTNRGLVRISDLKPGDKVLTLSCTSNPKKSEVILTDFHTYLHYDSGKMTDFLVIHLENGGSVSVTGDHLLFMLTKDSYKSIRAKELKPGCELLYVNDRNSNAEVQKVVETSCITGQGIYSPLTDNGTIVVQGVFASCYAHIDSHFVAHASMTPLLLWHRTRNGIGAIIKSVWKKLTFEFTKFPNEEMQVHRYRGIHKYAELLMTIRKNLAVHIFKD